MKEIENNINITINNFICNLLLRPIKLKIIHFARFK